MHELAKVAIDMYKALCAIPWGETILNINNGSIPFSGGTWCQIRFVIYNFV